jgi:hypothetical protein
MSLQELLAPLINPIKGTDEESYLVIYYFVFRELSLLWIARFIAEVTALAFIFSYRTEILSWIVGIFN